MGEATIDISRNGPLKITGLSVCRNSRGEPIPVQETVYFCRCGGSKNKPFCDGTHKKIGFTDEKN